MAISFKGAHFPPEVILMGVRWYLAYPLSTHLRGGLLGKFPASVYVSSQDQDEGGSAGVEPCTVKVVCTVLNGEGGETGSWSTALCPYPTSRSIGREPIKVPGGCGARHGGQASDGRKRPSTTGAVAIGMSRSRRNTPRSIGAYEATSTTLA